MTGRAHPQGDDVEVGQLEIEPNRLVEHQSSDQPMMGLRLLEYMVRVWSKLRRAASPQAVQLPVIVPVVLQPMHGGTGYLLMA